MFAHIHFSIFCLGVMLSQLTPTLLYAQSLETTSSTLSLEEARHRQEDRIKKTAQRRRLNRQQVQQHNDRLIKELQVDLPPRDFDWRYIVIHHTASEWSSLQRIDRYHRSKLGR